MKMNVDKRQKNCSTQNLLRDTRANINHQICHETVYLETASNETLSAHRWLRWIIIILIIIHMPMFMVLLSWQNSV